MKRLIVIFFLLNFSLWAQDSASVQVIARSLPDKVLLRWAVDQPLAWKKANEFGFWIERATISRNGEAVTPIVRKLLVAHPLKPKPLEQWETLAKEDQNVAILAQALFGDSFNVNAPGSKIGSIYAINDQLEQRFTFALVAAEQNYEGSKLAGWALEDSTVIAGEKYVYSVSVALPEQSALSILKGTVFASPDIYEPLPQPVGFTGIYKDRKITLSWNFNLLQHFYTNYSIEKSNDNISFEPLNGVPIFNAQQLKDSQEISMYYIDSIPNNTTFYYRIKGKTAFGETGPNSEVIEGKALKALGFAPRLYKKEILGENKVKLHWEFKDEGNLLINKFQLRKAKTNKGPFITVLDNIDSNTREVTYDGLERVNYFTVVAIGKNGEESESYSSLVQPIDSTPPAPPTELKAIMDTTGIIRLSWKQNTEVDLGGYRIFKSNNPSVEFSELTNKTLGSAFYTDTVSVKNLNRKVFYKITAEDLRYNRSGFSEILVVNKPNRNPPSPPVLNNYQISGEGVRINWIPSSSPDVTIHEVFRKKEGSKDKGWEKVFKSHTIQDSTFFDTTLSDPSGYSYTVIAKDSIGLESLPAKPISISWKGRFLKENDIKFSGTVNRELRFISLSWKAVATNVLEYRLYRGTDLNRLKLYKTFEGISKGFNDVDLEINTDYTYGIQLILNGGQTSMIKQINLKY